MTLKSSCEKLKKFRLQYFNLGYKILKKATRFFCNSLHFYAKGYKIRLQNFRKKCEIVI